jgi:hypothetical protein
MGNMQPHPRTLTVLNFAIGRGGGEGIEYFIPRKNAKLIPSIARSNLRSMVRFVAYLRL